MNTFSKVNINSNNTNNVDTSLQSEIKYKKATKHNDMSYQNDSAFSNNDQSSFNTITTPLFAKANNRHHQVSMNSNNSFVNNNHKKTATFSSDLKIGASPLYHNKDFVNFTASTIKNNTYTSNNTTTHIEFNANNLTNINSNRNVDALYYSAFDNNNTNTHFKYHSSGVLGVNTNYKLSSVDSTKLYEWLREINLLCYYPLFIENGIYNLDRIIADMKDDKIKLTYSDIEDIGIKKPGHIYRVLIKLEVDAGLIGRSIYDFILQTKYESELKNSMDVMYSKEYVCGCNIANRRTVVKNTKHYDLVNWLKHIDQVNKKDNFLYNGFEMIEFFILQMFSSIPIDEAILKNCLHIYIEKDRDVIIMQLNRDVRFIVKKLSGKYNQRQIQQEEESTSYKTCVVF